MSFLIAASAAQFTWWLDGSIIGVYLLVTILAGLSVRRYVGKVEHFLVAGREMNVYLGVASLAASEFGVITCMYAAQGGYQLGFSGAVPGVIQAIAMLVIGVTGFCIVPLRQSGVMTIPELLETRFGPRVRWAAGLVILLGGLLNMGVFLRVGGEFLIYVCSLNPNWLELTMTALLLIVAVYTICGGMLSVLVTDFLQFVVMSLGLLVVSFLILYQIGWQTLVTTVREQLGPGGFNPLANPKLGWSWLCFQILVNTAATLTWQTNIARILAAKDARTGQRIYTQTSFFFACRFLIPALWGIAALAYLPLADRPADSLHAMPVFLSQIIPTGILGLLIAAMLAADMSTDSSYMLTWGSIIYNDLLAPFRRQTWSDRAGLLCNRIIIALIGIFLLGYGLWYKFPGDVWSYLAVTGSIYLSSISVLLIACCYWRGANDWGAFAAIGAGCIFPTAYLVLEKIPVTKELATAIGPNWSGIAAFVAAAVAMYFGSIYKPTTNQNAVTSNL